jgi:uncharacterized protein (DUF4415 family)
MTTSQNAPHKNATACNDECEAERLRREMDEARRVLIDLRTGSLPADWTLSQMAEARSNELLDIFTAQKATEPAYFRNPAEWVKPDTLGNRTVPPPEKQKPGPKPSGKAKVMLTLRLDPDVVAKFRASGAGWQTRMAEALKQAVV